MPPKEATRPRRGKDAAAHDDTNKDAAAEAAAPKDTLTDEAIEKLMRQCRFKPDKLIGEVGDFLLSDFRAQRDANVKPYNQLSESDQRALIQRAHDQARHIVYQVVQSIAHKGIAHMEGQVEDAGSFKDGFFLLKVAVPMTAENALLLARRSGAVQIVYATAKDFESAMETQPEPDQQALIKDPPHDPETGEIREGDEDAPVFDNTAAAGKGKGKQNGAGAPAM